MAKIKFSTTVNEDVARKLRAHAREPKPAISDIVDEALAAHLETVRIRPAFRIAAAMVLKHHAEALRRLAK